MTTWQLIFLQSKVNGYPYNGDQLPQQSWDWPKETWFEHRLSIVRSAIQQPNGFYDYFEPPSVFEYEVPTLSEK